MHIRTFSVRPSVCHARAFYENSLLSRVRHVVHYISTDFAIDSSSRFIFFQTKWRTHKDTDAGGLPILGEMWHIYTILYYSELVCVWCGVRTPGDEQQLRESLVDWSIPFADLRFKDCFRAGLRSSIYRYRLITAWTSVCSKVFMRSSSKSFDIGFMFQASSHCLCGMRRFLDEVG